MNVLLVIKMLTVTIALTSERVAADARLAENIAESTRLLVAAQEYLMDNGMGGLAESVRIVGREAEVHGAHQGAQFPVCGYDASGLVRYHC